MFCEVCGKRIIITEIDKTEGIAWVCCPDFLRATMNMTVFSEIDTGSL